MLDSAIAWDAPGAGVEGFAAAGRDFRAFSPKVEFGCGSRPPGRQRCTTGGAVSDCAAPCRPAAPRTRFLAGFAGAVVVAVGLASAGAAAAAGGGSSAG